MARRHDPVANFGVHPGGLVVAVTGSDKAVGVHADAEVGAIAIGFHDLAELGIEILGEEGQVAGVAPVLIGGMDEPHGGIDRVVIRREGLIGETVGKKAAPHMIGERGQDGTGDIKEAGNKRKAGHGDEGVRGPSSSNQGYPAMTDVLVEAAAPLVSGVTPAAERWTMN